MVIRRRRWIIAALVMVGLLCAVIITVASRIPFSSDVLRQKVIAILSDRLDSDVELGDLTLRLFPRLQVRGSRLAIYLKGRRDVPPLISMNAFTVDVDLVSLWGKHLKRINVEGLDIQIAPKPEGPKLPRHRTATGRDYVIEELIADEGRLTIIPRDHAKKPRVWQMHELHVKNVGIDQNMPFQSLLTNAVPPGLITTVGAFGPWQVEDPGQTPINGDFTFDHADLGVFKGISGILSAHGNYAGALQRIRVNGETDTPDFMIKISGHTVPLKTKYRAIVDGTNGDTTLERIEASFLNTSFVAAGGVFHTRGVSGRTVSLEVTMDDARLEDLMRLAVRTDGPPMTGALSLRTTMEIPPGDQDVVDKLRLDGRFAIGDGRFTDREVQQKIVELSRRASVTVKETTAVAKVDSDFTGRFKLANGVLTLPSVTFDVPGAAVQLAGQYAMKPETIAFAGNLYMDAKISQTVTGWKSLLLKMADPLFRKDGRTVIPIKIAGTRNAPTFGLDRSRVFKRGDPEPDAKGTAGRR